MPVLNKPSEQGRIASILRERIQAGAWASGAKLPGRAKLAKELGVAVTTLERAMMPLIAEGTLVASDRSGTYVGRLLPARAETIGKELDRAPDEYRRGDGQNDRHGIVPVEASGSFAAIDRRTTTLGIAARVNIGCAIDYDINPTWMMPVLTATEEEFSGQDRSVRLFNMLLPSGDSIRVEEAVESLADDGVSAIVYIDLFNFEGDVERALQAANQCGLPIVFVAYDEILHPVPHVYYDNVNGGYQAVVHLYEMGWRRLLFIARSRYNWVIERLDGAKQALKRLGLDESLLEVSILGGEGQAETPAKDVIDAALDKMSSEPEAAWGVIAAQDYLGQAFMETARATRNWHAGADFAVIGFDDDPLSPVLGLSTMRPPLAAMGREAARLAWRCINGDTANMQARYRPILIPRPSTTRRQSR